MLSNIIFGFRNPEQTVSLWMKALFLFPLPTLMAEESDSKTLNSPKPSYLGTSSKQLAKLTPDEITELTHAIKEKSQAVAALAAKDAKLPRKASAIDIDEEVNVINITKTVTICCPFCNKPHEIASPSEESQKLGANFAKLAPYAGLELNKEERIWTEYERDGDSIYADSRTIKLNRFVEWTFGTKPRLSEQLKEWCDLAGWRLAWKAPCDYQIEAPARFQGDLEEALTWVIGAYKEAKIPLRLDLYPKQSLAVVSAM